MIPATVLITTLNEEKNLPRCLSALKDFNEIIIVDSNSKDKTKEIADRFGVPVVPFTWNGVYPKKRQWCLDHLNLKNDFVFFVDADEFVTLELVQEIYSLSFEVAGYFIKGQYIWDEKILGYGLKNNKLALFNRHKIEFSVIDDLDIKGMGEMEGHYQPVLKPDHKDAKLVQLNESLLHYAYENAEQWNNRHARYARWEAEMIKRQAYPKDPNILRERMKAVFRKLPCRGFIAFLHSYIVKCGFLDGCAGFQFAKSRYHYYKQVERALKNGRGSSNKAAR